MSPPKRTYQSERQQQRRASILTSARKVVSQNGYDGLTMRGLAEAAAVSPKTLYNLYGGKDELLLEALDDLLNGLVQTVRNTSNCRGFDYLLLRLQVFSEEIQHNPGYAHAMARALFKAKAEDKLVKNLLVMPIRDIVVQLKYEQRQGTLLGGLNLDDIALHIAVQNWGVLLLWSKDVFQLDQIGVEYRRSLLMTFAGISRGERSEGFRQAVAELP